MLSNFLGLIQNENMKIYRRGSFKVMMIILIGLILAIGLILKLNAPEASTDSHWKQELAAQVSQDKKQLQAVRSDQTNTENLKRSIAINQYRIDHNLKPAQSETLWTFVTQVAANMVTIIGVFTVIVVSTSIASEFDSGTIKLLLIRPIYRTEILLSKYIAALLFTVFSLIVLFIFSWLIGGILFGFGGAVEAHLVYTAGAVHRASWILAIWQDYLLDCVSLVMTVTAAGLIAAAFRNGGLAIGISIFMMLAGPTVTAFLSGYDWVKYVLFANTDLTQYNSGQQPRPEMTLGFSLITLAVYYIIFVLVGWLFFTKRDIKA